MHNLAPYFTQSVQFYYLHLINGITIVQPNAVFQHHFLTPVSLTGEWPVADLLSDTERAKLDTAIRFCHDHPGQVTSVALLLQNARGFREWINWECSLVEHTSPAAVQLLGAARSYEPQTAVLQTNRDNTERFMALEHSAEGLWMFESDVAVSVDQSPESVLSCWQEHSRLVECNENMAAMYGYTKKEELIGTRLSELMDFSDESRIQGLLNFIRNGFDATTVETREFDRHGQVKYFLNRMTGIVNNGYIKRVWGTQQDITEQRLAEEKLKESELFYRNLFVNSLDGLFITDEKGLIKFISPSVTPILGFDNKELLGHYCFAYIHPEDRALAVEAFDTERNGRTRIEFISLRVQKKNGEWLWCSVRGHNLLDAAPVNGMVISFYNDTARKKTEQALRDSEERFRHQAIILSNVTDVIVTTDLQRKITAWNPVAEKLSGITAGEATGKMIRYVLQVDYGPFTPDQIFDLVREQEIWRGEMSFNGFNGTKKYLLTTISLLRNEQGVGIGYLAIGKDITERKQAEARLQESELFYRNLIAHSLDGIVLTDEAGVINYCSPSVERVSGYNPALLLGHRIFEFIHPDDVALAVEAYEAELRNNKPVHYKSLRLMHASGQWVWCTVRGHNLMNNPVFHSVVIYFADDSKRKAMEDKLRESERRVSTLIRNLHFGVILQDPSGKMIMANQAALDLLGVTENQLLGTDSMDPRWNVIHEDGSDFPGQFHPVPEVIRTRRPVRDVVMGVYRPLTNDRIWLLVNAEPVFDVHDQLLNVVSSFADITEQRRLAHELIEQEIQKQRQITQATIDAQEKERIEIGKELHDNINQHLNTTRLYLEVAKEKATGEVLKMITRAHTNMAGIINEIRQLSQSLVPPTLGDLGLAESIRDLCDAIRRTQKFRITFSCRHFEETPVPENLRLTLFRIIQEKISNIIRHADASKVSIRLQNDAEHVILTVVDNGQGFDPKTAKEGLGLKNIRTRTALFNGKMELKTAPGEGCTMTVTIPLTPKA